MHHGSLLPGEFPRDLPHSIRFARRRAAVPHRSHSLCRDYDETRGAKPVPIVYESEDPGSLSEAVPGKEMQTKVRCGAIRLQKRAFGARGRDLNPDPLIGILSGLCYALCPGNPFLRRILSRAA